MPVLPQFTKSPQWQTQLRFPIFHGGFSDNTNQKCFVPFHSSVSSSFMTLLGYRLTYTVSLLTCLFTYIIDLLKTKIVFLNVCPLKPPALCLVHNRCFTENNNPFSKWCNALKHSCSLKMEWEKYICSKYITTNRQFETQVEFVSWKKLWFRAVCVTFMACENTAPHTWNYGSTRSWAPKEQKLGL